METMTVREVLEITKNNLLNISVPRALNQQIGLPIDGAIGNIQLCIDAIDRDEAEKSKKDTDGKEDPDFGPKTEEEAEALIRHAKDCFEK